MTKHLIFLLFVVVCVSLCLVAADELLSQRGMKAIKVRTKTGTEIELYKDSYALVVGNGTYTEGWNPLRGALQDVEDVAAALEKHDFTVSIGRILTDFSLLPNRACHFHGTRLSESIMEKIQDENFVISFRENKL